MLSLSTSLASSTTNLTNYLTSDFKLASGITYGDLCYRPSTNKAQPSPCFLHTYKSVQPTLYRRSASLHQTQTVAFAPGGRKEWINALRAAGQFTDDTGVKFEVEQGPSPVEEIDIGQMKGSKWIAYAIRAFVLRFWHLAKVRSCFRVLNTNAKI